MRRNKLLLVAGIIGSVYLVLLLLYYYGSVSSDNAFEVLGAMIGWALVRNGVYKLF